GARRPAGRGDPRSGAAVSAARPPSRAARRQDRRAQTRRRAGREAAGGRRAGNAQGRSDGRRRRRSAEFVTAPKLLGVVEQEVEEQGEVREREQLDPEREARRRLALAQIRQYPDPVLRMRANEIESFDDDLRRLVERMKELMQDANGVGLAGTQVGTLQRVFVFQPAGEDEAPQALVNPVLVKTSEVTLSDTEGCLSMQGVTIPVERQAHCATAGEEGRRGAWDPGPAAGAARRGVRSRGGHARRRRLRTARAARGTRARALAQRPSIAFAPLARGGARRAGADGGRHG